MTEQQQQEQPKFGKSALKAIVLDAVFFGCWLVFFIVATFTPAVNAFSFEFLAKVLFGTAVLFAIGSGIFILVLATQAGKINVMKILRFDMEKISSLILYLLLVCGIIFVIAVIAAGGVAANLLWGAWVIGVVGLGLMFFLLFVGTLWFLSFFQPPRIEVTAENPKN